MIVNAILVGLVFGGVIYWQTRDLVQVLPATAIMAVSIYFGSLASNRIARRIGRRIAGPQVEVEPLERSTDRPEHVQRRRSRRRPRGRRG